MHYCGVLTYCVTLVPLCIQTEWSYVSVILMGTTYVVLFIWFYWLFTYDFDKLTDGNGDGDGNGKKQVEMKSATSTPIASEYRIGTSNTNARSWWQC